MRTRLEPLDPERWSELTAGLLDYNYRQLWAFGAACARRRGAGSEHVAVYHGADLLGLADVRIKRTPVLPVGLAYITGGPMVRRGEPRDEQRFAGALHGLIDEYVGRRRLLLRVMAALGPPEWNAAQTRVFESLGFRRGERPPPYRTLLLDIDREPEAIRRTLAQKWRNGLNRAEKTGLQVRSGSDAGLFSAFCTLFDETLTRKRFQVDLHADFYAHVQRELRSGERFHVSLAEAGGRSVAGHVASLLGDTCVYLLGASTEEGLRCQASYLLQWATILTARQRGCRWYDLGGIDPEANPGVYHFKAGLGGVDVTAPGPFEMLPRGPSAHLVGAGERVLDLARRVRLRLTH